MIIKAKARKSGKSHVLYENMKIGEGGEGRVYSVIYNDYEAAKIYKEDNNNDPTHKKEILERNRKLEIMVANPPSKIRNKFGHPTIAFPTDILVRDEKKAKGEIIGFMMPKLKKQMKGMYRFCDTKSRLKTKPNFTYNYLLNTTINFVKAVKQIHDKGYVIGDINESNILVDEDSTFVTLIDTDSFQVTDSNTGKVYRCPVGKPEYTSPELQDKKFKDVDRFEHNDLFGMAVIIYQLLMENTHPFIGKYQGKGELPTYQNSIKNGFFIHSQKSPFKPKSTSPPFEALHPRIQRLFLRCFVDGHTTPSVRPTAKEWLSVLSHGKKTLRKCNDNSQHYFSNHLNSCLWCDLKKKLNGFDPFPTQAGVINNHQFYTKVVNQKNANSNPSPNTRKTQSIRPNPVIKRFYATRKSIKEGQKLTLSWNVINAQSVSISPGYNNLLNRGSIVVSPTRNITYKLTATAYGKSVQQKQPVEVETKPEVVFETSTNSVSLGDSITLLWDVKPNYAVKINNGIGRVNNVGQKNIFPNKNFWGLVGIRKNRKIVYRLIATSQKKTLNKKLDIAITIPDLPPKLAKYVSLNSKLIGLKNISTALADYINLSPTITLINNSIELLEHTYLTNHIELREISIPLRNFIRLRNRKTDFNKTTKRSFFKNFLKNFQIKIFPTNIFHFYKRKKQKMKTVN